MSNSRGMDDPTPGQSFGGIQYSKEEGTIWGALCTGHTTALQRTRFHKTHMKHTQKQGIE